MGAFHCPVGADVKGGGSCIECGMCVALTREERKAASDKVRAFLRSSASARLDRYVIRKIAVCGKGGVGKSTITAMTAIALRDMGYEVLVIDTDESNAGLHKKLSLTELPKPLITLLPRFSEDGQPDAGWLTADELTFEDIPEDYMVEDNRLRFMMAGKIEDALEGCACSLSDVVKLLLSKIKVEDRQIVIVDNEAGIESFGRGLEQYVDTILVVTEPSYESISMAGTIKYMAEGLGIKRVRAIINKVTSDKAEKITIKNLLDNEVKYLGALRMDDDILEAGLMGQQVAECDAKTKLEGIIKLLLDESEMKYNKI